jgi:SPP1 family predicted phage head-tail adaptor
MQAGDLDQRITLRHASLAADGHGGAVNTPTAYATVWASVKPMSGRERDKAESTEATSNYVVTVRMRDDVVEGDTIVWRGRILNVRFVRDKGPRGPWLEIEAEKGAA